MEKRLRARLPKGRGPGSQASLASGAYKGIGQDGDVQAVGVPGRGQSYTPIVLRGAKTLSLRLPWLYGPEGVIEQAKTMGKPGLIVMQPKGHDYKVVVMDYDQFMALMERWKRVMTLILLSC